jgi:hypothetical protein
LPETEIYGQQPICPQNRMLSGNQINSLPITQATAPRKHCYPPRHSRLFPMVSNFFLRQPAGILYNLSVSDPASNLMYVKSVLHVYNFRHCTPLSRVCKISGTQENNMPISDNETAMSRGRIPTYLRCQMNDLMALFKSNSSGITTNQLELLQNKCCNSTMHVMSHQ